MPIPREDFYINGNRLSLREYEVISVLRSAKATAESIQQDGYGIVWYREQEGFVTNERLRLEVLGEFSTAMNIRSLIAALRRKGATIETWPKIGYRLISG
mgnify:CR=1 FL=1